MKNVPIVIALILCAFAPLSEATDWKPYPGQLRGIIKQVLQDGVLVDGAFYTGESRGANPIIFRGTFFLRGVKVNDLIDGGAIDVKALPDGTYSYTTVLGANATVKAFRFIDE